MRIYSLSPKMADGENVSKEEEVTGVNQDDLNEEVRIRPMNVSTSATTFKMVIGQEWSRADPVGWIGRDYGDEAPGRRDGRRGSQASRNASLARPAK